MQNREEEMFMEKEIVYLFPNRDVILKELLYDQNKRWSACPAAFPRYDSDESDQTLMSRVWQRDYQLTLFFAELYLRRDLLTEHLQTNYEVRLYPGVEKEFEKTEKGTISRANPEASIYNEFGRIGYDFHTEKTGIFEGETMEWVWDCICSLYQRIIKLPNLTVDWNVDTFPELQAISVGQPIEWQAAIQKYLG